MLFTAVDFLMIKLAMLSQIMYCALFIFFMLLPCKVAIEYEVGFCHAKYECSEFVTILQLVLLSGSNIGYEKQTLVMHYPH